MGALTLVSALLSACSDSDGAIPTSQPTATATFQPTATTSVPASESASPSPNAPIEPSLPAGVPTSQPTNAAPSSPVLKGASAQVSLATVDPSTGGLLVGGFVTGVFEDGGACTFSVTPSSNGAPQSAFTTGIANVDSTSCGTVLIDSHKIFAGTYTVVLTYRNDEGQVSSAPTTVEVP